MSSLFSFYGINSVIKSAKDAGVEDQTKEGYETVKNPKFEVYTDKAGEFRFRLKAVNGQIIAVSEGFDLLSRGLLLITYPQIDFPDNLSEFLCFLKIYIFS